MSSLGLGEMIEGDSADTCAGKFPLISTGGRAEGLVCTDTSEDPHLRERKFCGCLPFTRMLRSSSIDKKIEVVFQFSWVKTDLRKNIFTKINLDAFENVANSVIQQTIRI